MTLRFYTDEKCSAAAEMGDRARAVGQKVRGGAAVPPSVGELDPQLTQRRLGRGLPPCEVIS